MKAVVVYESMYGNTHLIADAIAAGLRERMTADVVPADQARDTLVGANLVIVGGPTHAHGLSHSATRQAAADAARKAGSDLVLDPDAEGEGLRDWFEVADPLPARGAAFDTRIDMPAAITGRASKGIARRLHHHGCTLVVDPESFLVTKHNHLEPDEEARARAWGSRIAAILAPATRRTESRP